MAEAFIGVAIDEAVKLVVPPIKRQCNYLCCFTSNITNLEKETKKLDDVERGIEVRVDTDLNAGRVKDPTVDEWLAESKKIKDEKTAILDQVPNVGSVCFNLRARFSLSKRATKTAERMNKLREECIKFDVVTLPGPPAASKPFQLGNTYEFESRKQVEEEIMAVFKDGDVSMIGISGMGGLGKTTMAKRIKNTVLEEHVFEEAVFAVVSQPVEKPKIRLDIGGQLGLKLQDEPSETVRVQKLYERLSSTKRILLVLDDVWEPLELEEFGIPRDSKGCTILITSRNSDALRGMGVQKKFGMKILSEDEARFLFREKAGTCMDDAQLKSIAEEIVKECEGLPIALATVGAALKDEKSPSVWRDARCQLSQCDPDIPYFIERVYNPLKLSYSFLSSEDAKSLFLLCCLYPEDANIDIEELTCFSMGLGIFEGIKNLEEVRDRVSTLIKMLQRRSLLLDGEGSDDYVRMHDIVRDVCIFIAKQEGRVQGNNCCWISSFEQLGEGTKLPTGFRSPNLNLLFLSHRNYYSWQEEAPKLDNTIFEGISDLRVLCIQNYLSLTSLPPSHSLKNLKSLVLDSCYGLKTISFVGEFINLDILICRGCSSIEELPLEIKRLKGLKLLELTRCRKLERIGQGIISSLVELEELKMLDSFKRWGSEDREERKNAGLREVEDLTNLRCLEIEIEDPALAAEKIHLSSKIKRFDIKIGTSRGFNDHSYNKRMVLELKREEPYLGNSISMRFLRDTEYLNLEGNGPNSVDLAKCQNIRWLEFTDCETITLMVNDATALPASLEKLKLHNLPKLEGICDGPISSNSFHNLKELRLVGLQALKQLWKSNSPLFTNLSSIYINSCHRLRNLGQLSIAGDYCLPLLQELTINECEMMEQVFLWNQEDEIRNGNESQNYECITKVFPKLEEVTLCHLPNLATFYQGMGGIELPLLTKLTIEKCPKWKSMETGGSSGDIDDHSLHQLLCRPKKVSFANLNVVILFELHDTTSLFSSSVAGSLVNLQRLHIIKCNEMIKVITDNREEEDDEMLKVIEVNKEEDEDEKVVSFDKDSESQSYQCITKVFSKLKKVIKREEMLEVIEDNKEVIEEKVVSGTAEMPLILFPKLEELKLENLPKLVTFCEWKCDVKLPLLREVYMKRCPDMENLSLGFLAAPNLESFETDLKNNLQTEANVSLDNVKTLKITETLKPLYAHRLFISIFNGLHVLEVSDYPYGSMRCLFTSSIARRLDSLQELIIDYCYEMVKVIEDEENEEKVESGGERTLLFPKLKKLRLNILPKLVSFCEWKCDIELPSLREVKIESCPVLRTFTMESIAAAPNLENVQTDYGKIFNGTKDLNSVVQKYKARRDERRRERREEMRKMRCGEHGRRKRKMKRK